MFNKLIDNVKEIDKKILKVMFNGLNLSAIVCAFALVILVSYNTYPTTHLQLESGLLLFKTGLMFAASFFICGFATDKIKKQMT